MRLSGIFGVFLALTASACGGNASSPVGPGSVPTMTGTWVGSASDSTGSMMGAGMMNGAAWTITQTGNTFSGMMQLAGHPGWTMTISGTMAGPTGTFTMTLPVGPMMAGACGATATGTFDMDDMMTQLHGTYAGTNSCTGPFDHGQLSMRR